MSSKGKKRGGKNAKRGKALASASGDPPPTLQSQNDEDDRDNESNNETEIRDQDSDNGEQEKSQQGSVQDPASDRGSPLEGQFFDPPPLPPTILPQLRMSETTIMGSLNEAAKIQKLNGPDDWNMWNWKLKGHLGMVDMYNILTGDEPEPAANQEIARRTWNMTQERLSVLLTLITGPSAMSLLELNPTKNATELYKVLKDAYNKTTITTFGLLYRKIFECKLSNHKSLREYGDEVAIARNKLEELSQPLNELAVSCAFLNGLDASYQAWKDMYLGGYARDPTTTLPDGTEVMTAPTIEEILGLLIDRQAYHIIPKKTKNNSREQKPPVLGRRHSIRRHSHSLNLT